MPHQGQLILHIGNSKTGTTTLQHFFATNREKLATHHIVYPLTGTTYHQGNDHWDLMFEFVADYSNIWTIPEDYKRHPDGFLGLFHELQKEIDPILEEGQSIILSCEGFFFDNRTEKHIKKFTSFFVDYTPRIVIFLRRQDTFLDSMINELVKNNQIVYEPTTLTAFALDIIPYYQRLIWWSENFGRENIAVCPYEKSSFRGGTSIFSTFFDAAQLEFKSDYELPKSEENTALVSATAFIIINTINRLATEKANKRRFSQLIKQWECTQNLPDYTILDQNLQQFITKHSQHGNQLLAKEFLNQENGELFTEYPPATKKTVLNLVPNQQHLKNFVEYLKEYHQHDFQHLCKYIRNTPARERYGEFLNPLRMLCPPEIMSPPPHLNTVKISTQDRTARDQQGNTRTLENILKKRNQELESALFLLEQYQMRLDILEQQLREAEPQISATKALRDFHESIAYLYIVRPLWKLTGALKSNLWLSRLRQYFG